MGRVSLRRGLERYSHKLYLVGIALIAITSAAVGVTIWDQRTDAIENYQRNMTNLGVALAEETSRSMQAVDIVVKETEEKISASGVLAPDQFDHLVRTEQFHHFLESQLKSLPQAKAIAVTNSDGKVVNTSGRWPVPDIDISDRDFYRHFRDHADRGAVISAPTESRIDGAWTFFVARRVSGANGEFLGLVQGAIAVQYLEDFYKAITLQSGSSVTVLRSDGTIIARYPHIANMVGNKMPVGSPWYDRVKQNGGTFKSPGYFDGIVRVVTVHPLREYPLVVNLTISEDEALAHWRRQSIVTAIAAFCVAIGFAVLFRVLAAQFRQLRRSQDHLARAQRIASMGSYHRDLRTNQIEWSDETYRIYGLSRDAFVPTPERVTALCHPDDRAVMATTRGEADRGISPQPVEHRIIRADGTVRRIYRESEIVFDSAGKPVGLVGLIHDVTELRAAQQRQAELERQLQHSQKLEALGTLAGGIAHDLNNTLVPILSLSKLTARGVAEGSEEQFNLQTIYRASIRARDLVRQILAFSRKESLVKQQVDLVEVVIETLKMLKATLPANLQIIEKIEAVPLILGDAGQLQQVLVNLMTNAAQAIGDRPGRITVAISTVGETPLDRRDPTPTSTVRLSVADTGCGIGAGMIDRIFEPFFTTKAVGSGTGLGLAVVHGIVAGHGGRIEVRSKPGEGTEFTILMPVPGKDRDTESAETAAA